MFAHHPSVVTKLLLILFLSDICTSKTFHGITKSYQIHVEANDLGTNVHYDYPMAKVNSTKSRPSDWSVNNNDATLTTFLSPIFASTYVRHPSMEVHGTLVRFPGKLKGKYKVILGKRRNAVNNGNKRFLEVLKRS